jgi:hypothetical protein
LSRVQGFWHGTLARWPSWPTFVDSDAGILSLPLRSLMALRASPVVVPPVIIFLTKGREGMPYCRMLAFQAQNGVAATLDELALRVGLTSAAEVETVVRKAADAQQAIWEAYKMIVYKLASEYDRMGTSRTEDYVVVR